MARKRVDPKSTAADGRRNYEGVKNADPTREYIWANPNDEMTGVPSYEGRGFEIELRRPDGPVAAIGKTPGEGQPIMSLGQVLMSRPREEADIEHQAGQLLADALDRRILKDGNIEDGLRGQGFRLGVDQRETSKPFVELEGV